jgi:prepilin-type N-terminal cleavage/methylation domain-containing protein/prepilin-type processing-associated H-X9-DG protein
MSRKKISARRLSAFTLIELLVVIGIIGVLLAILLPALNRAREQANTVKCEANLKSIGESLTEYVAENHDYFPAAYIYNEMKLGPRVSGGQQPQQDDAGYIHWSSYLYKTTSTGSQLANQDIYKSTQGWDMFTCPSIPEGGLPATNNLQIMDDNPRDAPMSNPSYSDWLGDDYQAPRCAYTVNEAICPRNKFVLNLPLPGGAGSTQRIYQWIHAQQIQKSSSTILATEFNSDWHVVSGPAELGTGGGAPTVVKSHRPVCGFTVRAGDSADNLAWDFAALPPMGGGIGLTGPNAWLYRRAHLGPPGPATALKDGDLTKNPIAANVTNQNMLTTLDWVGRNHGSKKVDDTGWNTGTSNFLYVDGHVENKSISETVQTQRSSDPKDLMGTFEWGTDFYTIYPHGDLKQ